jgi:hypothetical protein
MATPYTAVLKFVCGDGSTFSTNITATDVAAAFWIFPSGAADFQLPGNRGNVALVDIIKDAAANGVVLANVFANDKNTGEVIQTQANLATNMSRQLAGCPITFAAGSRIRFTQA